MDQKLWGKKCHFWPIWTMQFQELIYVYLNSAPQNHWKDKTKKFIKKLSKLAPKTGFLAPKSLQRVHIKILRSKLLWIYSEQFPPHVYQVLEKSKGWIKSYGAKSIIFSLFGLFWGYFAPFAPSTVGVTIFFSKIPSLLFIPFKVVPSSKISENLNE